MKKAFLAILCLSVLSICIAIPQDSSAEGAKSKNNSFNIGVTGLVGPDLWASVVYGEYERLLSNRFSMFGRVGQLNYEYDDGTYIEEGNGPGIDIGVRLYPRGEGMKGFFIGGTVGYWKTDWEWTDDAGTTYETKGEGSSNAVKVDFEIGGRINLGSETISLIPSAHIGNFFGISSDCKITKGSGTCSDESELGFYGIIGLALGIAF